MNLAALSKIEPSEQQPTLKEPMPRTLPDNEIQRLIESVCHRDMHYDNIFSAVGKLVSGSGIPHGDLKANSQFFEQFISVDSGTLKTKSVLEIIEDHEAHYGNQVGSRPAKSAPANCFSEEVYNNLPGQLKAILFQIPDARKKDVALMGMITALSAAAARYRFHHGAEGDVKEYSPHLLSTVIGQAGVGKGNTRHGVTLVSPITEQANNMRKDAQQKYKIAKHEFDRERRKREKDSRGIDDLHEPDRPKKYAFFISASDTTQAALVEALHENETGCFAYDSELDTLTQGNQRKDYGGYSDVIRKVSHHEPLSRQRKGDNESYTVYNPRLAVMLSGTHDQLKKLIQSEQNGLFSRQWFYIIPPSFQEYEPAKQQKDVVGDMCRALAPYVAERANLWSPEIVHLTFTDEQEEELTRQLRDKRSIEERYGGDIGASWLRMALSVKRIAATLSWFEGSTGEVPANCWKAAIGLLPAIKTHCIAALDLVRQNQGKVAITKEEYEELNGQGLTDMQIADRFKCDRKSIYRRKAQWYGENGTK